MDASMPQPSTKPIKPRKYRLSCDACSNSKVKCNQQTPECQRCVNLGLKCHYSESRRMGKPPASSRKLTTSSNASSSESEPGNTPPSKKRRLSPPSFLKDYPTPENDHIAFDPIIMDTDEFMAMSWQNDIFQVSNYDVPQTVELPLTAANLFDLNFDFMGTSSPPLPNNQFFFGNNSSLDSSREPSYDSFPQLHLQTSPLSRSSPASSIHTPKLCTHNLDVKHTPPPSPPSTNASMDQVLINNKVAIENAYALLASPCSDNPHFALTLALMCTKILGKYEEVIKATPVPCFSPLSGRRRSSSDTTSITAGPYKMDAEDEERMRIQIVVNEVGKVKGLVDKYQKKYCRGVDGSKRGGGEIFSALEAFLRSELTSTLRDLVTKLES